MNDAPYKSPAHDAPEICSADLLRWLRWVFVPACLMAGAFTAHRTYQLHRYEYILRKLEPAWASLGPPATLWVCENRFLLLGACLLVTVCGAFQVLRSSRIKALITAAVLTLAFNLTFAAALNYLIEAMGLWNFLPFQREYYPLFP
jgi:hypothetical protein